VDQARGDSVTRRGVSGTLRPLLDPSVIYLRAGANAAYGSERAIALLDSPQPQAAPFTAWQPMGGSLSRDQLSAYTFGVAVRAAPELPGTMVESYIAFWSRTRGGPWRIAAYMEVSRGSLSVSPGPRQAPVRVPREAGALIRADSQLAERVSSLVPRIALRDAVAPDGVLLTTPQIIVGQAAVTDYFESQRSISITWVPRDARVAASGDLGFTIGDAVTTSRGPTGAAGQRFTKYLTVWRRDNDKWRIVVSGANDRPSPIGD
jgi:ketosteroid isomerase-like protein